MTEEQVKDTHYNLKDLNRRWDAWEECNVSQDGSFVLMDFYMKNGIEYLEIDRRLDE